MLELCYPGAEFGGLCATFGLGTMVFRGREAQSAVMPVVQGFSLVGWILFVLFFFFFLF